MSEDIKKTGPGSTTETVVKKEEVNDSVSRKEFDSLKEEVNGGFKNLADLIKNQAKVTPEEKAKAAVVEKKVDEASADIGDMNPRYHAKVVEVLGSKVERTFLTYPKGGGTLFTIVIKREFSNAPKDYLERMKEDRRTVNIEREEFRGEDGVEKWAKLIQQNLNRTLR